MSDPHPQMPAIEAVLVGALKAETDLDATFSNRIATRLPAEPTFPFLTLRRSGGFRPVERWLAAVTVEFEVWGGKDEEEATEVAADLAESVVLALQGDYASAVVTGVQPVLGPRNVGDPETGRPRYIFETRVFVHPAG